MLVNDVQLKGEDNVVIAMMDGSSDNVLQPYTITG